MCKELLAGIRHWLNQPLDKSLPQATPTIPAPTVPNLGPTPPELPFDALKQAEQYWNSKHPTVSISYNDRLVPGTSTPLAADIRLFCQPGDPFIVDWLKQNGLMVADPAHCEDEIMAIYELHQKTWMHYDQLPIWGAFEYWCFPFEMRARVTHGLGAVCHDFAPSIMACLLTAGVPAFRVRGLCGTTFQGEGHSTVTVLADDLVTWRHLNSTTPFSMIPNGFDQLPVWNDPQGLLDIQTVWFSYNSEFAWSTMDGAADPAFLKLMQGKLSIEQEAV